jgi:hypothetical protein
MQHDTTLIITNITENNLKFELHIQKNIAKREMPSFEGCLPLSGNIRDPDEPIISFDRSSNLYDSYTPNTPRRF